MSTYVAVFALALAYIALVAAYGALRTLARLRRATTVLGRGAVGRESLLEATQRHVEITTAVANELHNLRSELAAVKDQAIADVHREQQIVVDQLSAAQGNLARSLRNVALVRFDAFDDLSGRASFALALLDDAGDGITLTSIAGRTDSRTYAKGIVAGKCEQELSPEESEAVAAAVSQPGDRGAKLSHFVARRRAS
jgi:Protein of unknown function (DUF4446)